MKFDCRTHQGLVRQDNQDSVLCFSEIGLWGVADGMGGHRGGKTASSMAAEAMRNALRFAEFSKESIVRAVSYANKEIYYRQLREPELNGMGTTLSVIWEKDSTVMMAHVGDSRVYLMEKGILRQISSDHSYVAELVRQGSMTKEEAKKSTYRNVITRAVGTEPVVETDYLEWKPEKGSRFLICSDGLTEHVDDLFIQKALSGMSLENAAEMLLAEALEKGGTDNITVVVTEVE